MSLQEKKFGKHPLKRWKEPEEAGANFTWDTVELNLRSVCGERGVGGEEREVEGRDGIGI